MEMMGAMNQHFGQPATLGEQRSFFNRHVGLGGISFRISKARNLSLRAGRQAGTRIQGRGQASG